MDWKPLRHKSFGYICNQKSSHAQQSSNTTFCRAVVSLLTYSARRSQLGYVCITVIWMYGLSNRSNTTSTKVRPLISQLFVWKWPNIRLWIHSVSGQGLVAVLRRHPRQHLEVAPAVRGPLRYRRPAVRPHLHPRLCPRPPRRRDEHDRGRQEHEGRCGEEVQAYPLRLVRHAII